MNATDPGVEIFSAEWMRLAGAEVPPEWHAVILDICQSYALGNTADPALIYGMFVRHGVQIESAR